MAHHFIENSYVFHIFAWRADENSIRRLKARITSVNFQPFVKPTLNAMKKVATTWINIFSPIPSLILEMWLENPAVRDPSPRASLRTRCVAVICALDYTLPSCGHHPLREEGKHQRKGRRMNRKVVSGRRETRLQIRQGWWQNGNRGVQWDKEEWKTWARKKSKSRNTHKPSGTDWD